MKRPIFIMIVLFLTLTSYAQDISNDSIGKMQHAAFKIINTNPRLALSQLQESLELSKKYKFTKRIINGYRYLSYCEKRLGNYPVALEYQFEVLKISEEIKDTSKIGVAYTDIATMMRLQDKNESAIEYYNKAIEINLKQKDSLNLALNTEMKGAAYANLEKSDSALRLYDEAEAIYKKLNRPKGLLRIRLNKAKLLYKIGKLEESLTVQLNQIKKIKSLKNDVYLVSCYGAIAQNYFELKQYDLSKKYSDSAISIAEKNGFKDRLMENLKLRSKNFAIKGNYKEALEDQINHKTLYDSIFNSENVKRYAEIEQSYIYEKKRFEDSLSLESDRRILETHIQYEKTRKVIWSITAIISIIALTLLFLYYQNRQRLQATNLFKEKLERDLLSEKLENLQYQAAQLKADNEMRVEFKRNLLERIRTIRSNTQHGDSQSLQTIIAEIQTQIGTENRIDKLKEVDSSGQHDWDTKISASFPELTRSERETLKLIKMGLSLKEIMNVRNTTMASVKSIRYRIRKKLNIPKDIEMETYINSLLNR